MTPPTPHCRRSKLSHCSGVRLRSAGVSSGTSHESHESGGSPRRRKLSPRRRRIAGTVVCPRVASLLSTFDRSIQPAPTNAKAELAPEVAADTAYGEAGVKGLIRFDPGTIEANRASWVEQWNKTIAR